MSTAITSPHQRPWLPVQPPWPRRDGLFRFTVEQFYQLAELGFFVDRHVELIGGVIYEMTVHPPHAIATELAASALRRVFADSATIRQQNPFDTGRRSLPEPDVAVVPGSIRDYAQKHPSTAIMVVEVAEATLRKDRGLKAHLYASAGVPEYWIVNLVDRQLEVHRNPGVDRDRKGRYTYHNISIIPADGAIAPVAQPDALINVTEILP